MDLRNVPPRIYWLVIVGLFIAAGIVLALPQDEHEEPPKPARSVSSYINGPTPPLKWPSKNPPPLSAVGIGMRLEVAIAGGSYGGILAGFWSVPTPKSFYSGSPGRSCTKGCRCGNSCISCAKTCRK